MDGAERAFAAPGFVALRGQEYRAWPFTMNHWAELGMFLTLSRPSASELARSASWKFRDCGLEGRLINIAMAETRKDLYIKMADAEQFRDSLKGTAFRLWCQIRRNDKRALTRQNVADLFWKEFSTKAESGGSDSAVEWAILLRSRLSIISGEDDRAELDWPSHDKGNDALSRLMKARGGYQPIPWRRILRSFAENYGWTPEKVGRMTLYQIRVYWEKESNLGPGIYWRGMQDKQVGGSMGAARQARKMARELGGA